MRKRAWIRRQVGWLTLPMLSVLFVEPASLAQSCSVPGSHPTIQEAVDDPGCDPIVLEAQSYTESLWIARSLRMTGPTDGGAILQGLVFVTEPPVQVTLDRLQVRNGCPGSALEVVGGSQVGGSGLEVIRGTGLPCPPLSVGLLFADGFESGDPSAWTPGSS